MGALTANLLIVLLPVVTLQYAYAAPVEKVIGRLSMFGHFAGSFSRGLIDSGHMVWYAAATTGLLVLAARSLEARRWR